MPLFSRTVLLSSLAIATLASGDAGAVTRELAFQSNASGVCQAALPAFEGLIRKRPMAIQNEGSAPAFVTCSPVNLQNVQSADFGHGLYLVNNGATEVAVSCTAVVGARSGTPEVSMPKTISIAPGANEGLYWDAGDGLPDDNGSSFNTSCALPPGTGITTVYTNQLLDVGS